jgi:tetratricopeptide (TPR) repeat protein
MIREWFKASDAAEIGIALADQFARPPASSATAPGEDTTESVPVNRLQDILQRADREVRPLQLNFFKKAKFANSFKWRLLENGVKKEIADEVTQALVVHLSGSNAGPTLSQGVIAAAAGRLQSGGPKQILAHGNRLVQQGEYEEAIALYENWMQANPRDVAALNSLGIAFIKVGRYEEAEHRLRQAATLKQDYAEAHANLGSLLVSQGRFTEAESSLRRALKLNPRFTDARINLGSTLAARNRLRDAKTHFDKAIKFAPRNSEALLGMALIAKTEGRFEQASTIANRALEGNPKMPRALAFLAGMRKMTSSDNAWVARAETLAAEKGMAPANEAELRFAIGKYYDDVENFKLAFDNYKRGNDLLKPLAASYDQVGHASFVDNMIRLYPRGTAAPPATGTCASQQPVFVVGMPRSGTSLTEQIIASHPSAKGVGELEFWIDTLRKYASEVHEGVLNESTRQQIADGCLHILREHAGDVPRIVDKTPFNSDYLGLIHSVFPNARIIYMQRDPIDTCLSCYFQKFPLSLNYTLDLSDLANYYQQHARLMAHWRAVLPPGTILDVPYEGLVAEQELWTRKILEFLALEWDERCLEFHRTNRTVATASFWQVRQKIYKNSVARWRNYEPFIKPLRVLAQMHA